MLRCGHHSRREWFQASSYNTRFCAITWGLGGAPNAPSALGSPLTTLGVSNAYSSQNTSICPETAVLCCGYSLHNRLQKPGGRGLFNMNAIQHSQSRRNQDNGKAGPCACVKGERQENQFQTEIGRMTDEAIDSALLQALSGARRYVGAEGPAQRNDCYDTNSEAENQNSKGRRPQPAITSGLSTGKSCASTPRS